MPLPAILGALLPYAGSAAAGAVGSYLGKQLAGGNNPQSNQAPGLFSGVPSKTEQLPRFTPQQQEIMNAQLQQGKKNFNFEDIANLARQDFQQKGIPALLHQFLGSRPGQTSLTSPAFTNALGNAQAGLESQLAALRSNIGRQQLQFGLQPSFENIYLPAQHSLGGSALAGAIPGVSQSLIQMLPQLLQYLSAGQGNTTNAMPVGIENAPSSFSNDVIRGLMSGAQQAGYGV